MLNDGHHLTFYAYLLLKYTVKVRLLGSIFTRYMALFKVPWCLALETSLKRPKQETCPS